jgi:anti-sigma factor RsiW
MTCERTRAALIAYHFGVATDEERNAIEAHLPACSACVVELVTLKRAIEVDDARPSPAARDRLRAAVAAELQPRARRRWERPLAFAFAAAAIVAAMFATQSMTTGPGAPPLGVTRAD